MEMWMRKIGSPDETRYILYTCRNDEVIVDTNETEQLFLLVRYWKNNNGEFERCKTNSTTYITISALLKDYVLIGSNVDAVLKQQNEDVYKLRKAAMEENTLISSFHSTCISEDDNNCPPEESKDEGD